MTRNYIKTLFSIQGLRLGILLSFGIVSLAAFSGCGGSKKSSSSSSKNDSYSKSSHTHKSKKK